MDLKIGVPNDEEVDRPQRRKMPTQYFDVEEGSNIFRVLPPFGELAEAGTWCVKTVSHWGYKSSEGRPKNFLCLGRDCPECALQAKVKEDLEKAQNGSEIAKMCENFLYAHNLDIRHNMNVLDQKNKIGLLRIKKKMNDDFARERKNLKKFGIHPAHVETGVWLDFYKSGKMASAVWRVSAVQEQTLENGQVVSKMKTQPLSQDVLNRMNTEAFELNKLVRALTMEQVTLLVRSVVDLEADPEVVDAVFGIPTKTMASASNGDLGSSETSPVEAPAVTATAPKNNRSISDSAFENFLRTSNE